MRKLSAVLFVVLSLSIFGFGKAWSEDASAVWLLYPRIYYSPAYESAPAADGENMIQSFNRDLVLQDEFSWTPWYRRDSAPTWYEFVASRIGYDGSRLWLFDTEEMEVYTLYPDLGIGMTFTLPAPGLANETDWGEIAMAPSGNSLWACLHEGGLKAEKYSLQGNTLIRNRVIDLQPLGYGTLLDSGDAFCDRKAIDIGPSGDLWICAWRRENPYSRIGFNAYDLLCFKGNDETPRTVITGIGKVLCWDINREEGTLWAAAWDAGGLRTLYKFNLNLLPEGEYAGAAIAERVIPLNGRNGVGILTPADLAATTCDNGVWLLDVHTGGADTQWSLSRFDADGDFQFTREVPGGELPGRELLAVPDYIAADDKDGSCVVAITYRVDGQVGIRTMLARITADGDLGTYWQYQMAPGRELFAAKRIVIPPCPPPSITIDTESTEYCPDEEVNLHVKVDAPCRGIEKLEWKVTGPRSWEGSKSFDSCGDGPQDYETTEPLGSGLPPGVYVCSLEIESCCEEDGSPPSYTFEVLPDGPPHPDVYTDPSLYNGTDVYCDWEEIVMHINVEMNRCQDVREVTWSITGSNGVSLSGSKDYPGCHRGSPISIVKTLEPLSPGHYIVRAYVTDCEGRSSRPSVTIGHSTIPLPESLFRSWEFDVIDCPAPPTPLPTSSTVPSPTPGPELSIDLDPDLGSYGFLQDLRCYITADPAEDNVGMVTWWWRRSSPLPAFNGPEQMPLGPGADYEGIYRGSDIGPGSASAGTYRLQAEMIAMDFNRTGPVESSRDFSVEMIKTPLVGFSPSNTVYIDYGQACVDLYAWGYAYFEIEGFTISCEYDGNTYPVRPLPQETNSRNRHWEPGCWEIPSGIRDRIFDCDTPDSFRLIATIEAPGTLGGAPTTASRELEIRYCPTVEMCGAESTATKSIRNFRDAFLTGSKEGSELIKTYTRCSGELGKRLSGDRKLAERTAAFLLTLPPILEKLEKYGNPACSPLDAKNLKLVNAATLKDGLDLLPAFRKGSSPELGKTLDRIEKAVSCVLSVSGKTTTKAISGKNYPAKKTLIKK